MGLGTERKVADRLAQARQGQLHLGGGGLLGQVGDFARRGVDHIAGRGPHDLIADEQRQLALEYAERLGVAVVDVKARRIEDYILVGTRAWNAVLSRDEKRLIVANGLSDDISIIDTAARKVTKSVPVGRVPYMVVIDD